MNELQFKLKHKRWQFSKILSKKASHRRIHLRTYMLGIFHPTPYPPCSSSPLLSAPDLYEPYMSSCAFCFPNFWSQLGNPTGDGKEGRKGNQCMSSPSCLPPRWPVSLSLSLLLSMADSDGLPHFESGNSSPSLYLSGLNTATEQLQWNPTWFHYRFLMVPTSTPLQRVSAKTAFEWTYFECAICLLLDPEGYYIKAENKKWCILQDIYCRWEFNKIKKRETEGLMPNSR